MRAVDYPPQEPVSPIAAAYRDACVARSFGVPFVEQRYGADPYQSVAIYPSERPDGALLAFVHGGGWTSGYKEWMGFMAPAFTARGISFASIGYRLAPQHLFPAGLDDVAAGVAWLVAQAPRLGFDPRKLVLGGHSAGGHYSALLAVRRDWQAALSLPADVIKGCLPISGVYRFGEGSGLSMRPRFLGEGANVERDASPIDNIQGAIQVAPPPFLIAYGDVDFPHLIRQAQDMEAALRAVGGEISRTVLPDCDHFRASLAGGDADGPWVPEAAARIVAWTRRR
jgi:acetyl esterase/lipase